ncbi:unannotated protein [freshwater metagenome]|uniref:Unannotated protein n=1 Tax=freshwater metagenome TaxID=449393 RepID=A0A6J7D0C6_9ZZZZ
MHEPFNTLFNTHESTEWDELGDNAGDNLAHLVSTGELLPWVFLG